MSRWKRYLRWGGAALGLLLLLTSPYTMPALLSRLDYFHVRRIEFEGIRYTRPAELLRVIAVDTSRSVWEDLAPIEDSVRTHPMVEAASVDRRLPGTLVIHVTERVPVALVSDRNVLHATDATGRKLPINLAETPVDAPIVTGADTVIFRVLDELRRDAPGIFARLVSATRIEADHLFFDLGAFNVRTRDDVTVARFRDILPVEADLAREQLRALELDLRFENQVIVRQP